MATGSKVPFNGLKEEEEEDGEDDEEEEEEEGFFQKVLTLLFSWLLSRRLWLGPQCSKLPLPSCCKQPPPAGPPGAGDGWLKSFQRSRRMCFTSKSFRPEPDMLDARRQRDLAGRGSRRASWWGRPAEPGVGKEEEEEDCSLCTPGAHAARRDARLARQPPERGPHSRAAQRRSGPEGPARGEPTGREQRQEPNAEGRDSSIRARVPRGYGREGRPG